MDFSVQVSNVILFYVEHATQKSLKLLIKLLCGGNADTRQELCVTQQHLLHPLGKDDLLVSHYIPLFQSETAYGSIPSAFYDFRRNE